MGLFPDFRHKKRDPPTGPSTGVFIDETNYRAFINRIKNQIQEL